MTVVYGGPNVRVGDVAANAELVRGSFDPSVAGQAAGLASLFFRLDTGQVYRKSGAANTAWSELGASTAVINEPWAPRITPHAADDEFNTAAVGASWAQTGFSASLSFATRPSPYTNVGANNRASWENRRDPDNSAQTSWLRIQPGAGRAGLWKRLDTAAFGGAVPANLLAWVRYDFSWRNGTAGSSGDEVGLCFFNESGGGFLLSSFAVVAVNGCTWTTGSVNAPVFFVRNNSAGTSAIITQGTRQNNSGTQNSDYAFYSGYAGLQKIGNAHYGWIIDDGGRLYMGEALPIGGGGVGPNNVNAVAVFCSVSGSSLPGTMLYDFDFIRFYQGADWIP